MSKHTPVPWKLFGKTIASADESRYIGFSEKEEDSEFIVRACNNHDALLAACKELLAVVAIQNGNLHQDTNEIMDRADAAITNSEKK